MNRYVQTGCNAIALAICIFMVSLTITPKQAQAAGTIVAFGDSITAGYPYHYVGNGCTNCGGYEPTLQYYLDNWDGRGRIVYNYGVSGEYINHGLNRIDSVMLATYPAEYVLIMEGTNDLSFYVDPGTVAYYVYALASQVIKWGATPIVATLTPDTRYGADWKNIGVTNSYIKSYVNSSPMMCLSDQNAALAPYWYSGYNYDGLHPNWWGYWLVGWTWYGSIYNCVR